MGAYGYRGFFERKPRFLQSVPYAARNMRRLLEHGSARPAARAGGGVPPDRGRVGGPGEDADRAGSDGADQQLQLQARLPRGRGRPRRRLRLRLPRAAEPGPAPRVSHAVRPGRGRGRVHRAAVGVPLASGARALPGRRAGRGVPAPGLHEPDRQLRLHRRPAPVRLLRGATRRTHPGCVPAGATSGRRTARSSGGRASRQASRPRRPHRSRGMPGARMPRAGAEHGCNDPCRRPRHPTRRADAGRAEGARRDRRQAGARARRPPTDRCGRGPPDHQRPSPRRPDRRLRREPERLRRNRRVLP
jgi:hypothetical protein